MIPDFTPIEVINDDSYSFTADNEDVLGEINTLLEIIRGTPPQAPDGFSDTVLPDGNVPFSTPDMLTGNMIPSVSQALMTQVIDQSDIATKSPKLCTDMEEEVNGLQKKKHGKQFPERRYPTRKMS